MQKLKTVELPAFISVYMLPFQKNLILSFASSKNQVGILDAEHNLTTFNCYKDGSNEFKPLTLCYWNDETALCGGENGFISVILVSEQNVIA